MTVMISYARQDLGAVTGLVADLQHAHVDVWFDRELSGGQAWWDAILAKIRSCDLFVVCLSPDSLASRACASELDYAVRLNRPILPVMLRSVSVQLTPPVIANTQIIDYRTRSVDAAIALVSAVAGRPAAPPLPADLPSPPPAPISYMNAFGEAVNAPALSFKEQLHLVAELKVYLDDPADHDAAAGLLRRLRRRPDISESVARGIDQLLNAPIPPGPRRESQPKVPFSAPTSGRKGPIPNPHLRPPPPPTNHSTMRSNSGPASVPPVTRSPSISPALPWPVKWIHLVSGILVLVMLLALLIPWPADALVFFGTTVAGFVLSVVAAHFTGQRPQHSALRTGAIIWAVLWAVFFVLMAVILLATL